MPLSYHLLRGSRELEPFGPEVAALFETCFARTLDEKLWHWAFGRDSLGDSLACVCRDETREAGRQAVGFYVFVPTALSWRGQPLNARLSMTSMVDAAYRRHGVFVEMATQLSEVAARDGVQIVIGFPNASAAPGLVKRLQWRVGPPDYVALAAPDELRQSASFVRSLEDANAVRLNARDEPFLRWRLSKPGAAYTAFDAAILKVGTQGREDDLVWSAPGFEAALESDRRYHVLVDGANDKLRAHQAFEYRFGYRLFDADLEGVRFHKDLLLSDVF